jgi:hypothetical protein
MLKIPWVTLSYPTGTVLKVLRWILVLPAAAICGYLAYFVGGFVNNLTIVLFLGAQLEGWLKVSADFMAHMYLGAAFTYSAVRIAPSLPKHVAFVALTLVLGAAGISLWSSFHIGKFYAVPAIFGLTLGGAAVLFGTLRGEIAPYKPGI